MSEDDLELRDELRHLEPQVDVDRAWAATSARAGGIRRRRKVGGAVAVGLLVVGVIAGLLLSGPAPRASDVRVSTRPGDSGSTVLHEQFTVHLILTCAGSKGSRDQTHEDFSTIDAWWDRANDRWRDREVMAYMSARDVIVTGDRWTPDRVYVRGAPEPTLPPCADELGVTSPTTRFVSVGPMGSPPPGRRVGAPVVWEGGPPAESQDGSYRTEDGRTFATKESRSTVPADGAGRIERTTTKRWLYGDDGSLQGFVLDDDLLGVGTAKLSVRLQASDTVADSDDLFSTGGYERRRPDGPWAGVTTTTTPGGISLPESDSSTIRFDGVGDLSIGQVASGFTTTLGTTDAGECGSLRNLDIGTVLIGTMTGDREVPSRARVREIRVFDAGYRTPAGAGVTTTLAALRRIYGDRLVVDEPDGYDHPTDGLLAQARKVAGVRNGAGALTFVLEDDVVRWIEISAPDQWGDDEGCA